MSALPYIDFDAYDQQALVDVPPDSPPLPVASPVHIDVAQNTDEWFQVRCGKITASRISDVLAGGKGITREKYLCQLAIERLTNTPVRGGFKSRATEHGNAYENEALELYSLLNDVDIEKVGFACHPTLANAGCSPDALVGIDGMVQVKAPDPHTHVGYCLSKQVPRDYALQIQWEMACTGRQWSDFISYDPDQIPRLRLLTIRIVRDGGLIRTLEQAAVEFDQEVNDLVTKLRTL